MICRVAFSIASREMGLAGVVWAAADDRDGGCKESVAGEGDALDGGGTIVGEINDGEEADLTSAVLFVGSHWVPLRAERMELKKSSQPKGLDSTPAMPKSMALWVSSLA